MCFRVLCGDKCNLEIEIQETEAEETTEAISKSITSVKTGKMSTKATPKSITPVKTGKMSTKATPKPITSVKTGKLCEAFHTFLRFKYILFFISFAV